MTAKRAAIIANPVKIDMAQLRRLLPAMERAHGYADTLILETTADSPGTEQTREAIDAGVDVVIAAGGDGTVRLVADALAHSDVPIGIIPAGTGNLLARNLGLVDRFNRIFDLEDALEVAFGNRERRIDLGEVEVERPDGEHERFRFSIIAGVGIDAGMIEHTDEELKAKIGWLAYGGGIARWLVGSGAFSARYKISGGRTWGTRASSIMIGNSGSLPGGLNLLPDAAIDDGLIDMVIMRPRGPLGWSMVAAGVIARNLPKVKLPAHGAVNYFQGEEILLRLDGGPQHFELDGDTEGEVVALRAHTLEGALVARVPVTR
jgi:diacylglycerol kinase family enzyme